MPIHDDFESCSQCKSVHVNRSADTIVRRTEIRLVNMHEIYQSRDPRRIEPWSYVCRSCDHTWVSVGEGLEEVSRGSAGMGEGSD